MSTPESAPPEPDRPEIPISGSPVRRGTATIARPAHPDSRWASDVHAALDEWIASGGTLPTSSITGGGAIGACEQAFSALHADRPALLLPSGSAALRAGLAAVGVGPGDEVVIPALDWSASYAAVLTLQAIPVLVGVDPNTLTISPAAAARTATARTRAIVACHLHGVAADVPALRAACPGIPVVEDAAGALGSTLDGRAVGTLGDVAAFSFGPGKQIDAGEGGMLLCADDGRYRAALAATSHPVRQRLSDIWPVHTDAFEMRPHPMAAVLALYRLARWDAAGQRERYGVAAAALAASGGRTVQVIGGDGHRGSAADWIPVLIPGRTTLPGVASGCSVIPGTPDGVAADLTALIARLRLVGV